MTGTKLTLETEYGVVSVEFNQGDLKLDMLFEHLIEPVLLASGYARESIEKYYRGQE